MKLNVEKIELELERLGRNKSWLAERMKRSRQQIQYLLSGNGNSVTLKTIERIGSALSLDPKDLII